MNWDEAAAYLTTKIEDAGFVVLSSVHMPIVGALLLEFGSKHDDRRCAISVTGLDMLNAPDPIELLESRLEQSFDLMRDLAA